MQVLQSESLSLVSGGNPAIVAVGEAALTGAGIYSSPYVVYESTIFLNDVGHSFGEWAFEITHPNILGQTEFNASDFGLSYIAPSFPDSYFS